MRSKWTKQSKPKRRLGVGTRNLCFDLRSETNGSLDGSEMSTEGVDGKLEVEGCNDGTALVVLLVLRS